MLRRKLCKPKIKKDIFIRSERLENVTSDFSDKLQKAQERGEFIVVTVPKKLKRNTIGDFLWESEFIFDGKYPIPLIIQFHDASELDYLGYLLIYGIIRYSVLNKTASLYFFFAPDTIREELEKNGFGELYNQYFSGKIKNSTPLEFSEDSFFIFPRRITESLDKNQENIVGELISKIFEFYDRHKKYDCAQSIVFCITEILSNFWAHSKDKKSTIVLAKGSHSDFSIKILDSGCGIITSMAEAYPQTAPQQLLTQSIERGFSSKASINPDSHHMGLGLYYVSQIANHNSGYLDIWSEGFHCRSSKHKTTVKECGYWQGTIIDLSFKLSNFTSVLEQ